MAHETVIEVEAQSPLELARRLDQDDPPPRHWRQRLRDLAEMLEHSARRAQHQCGSGVPAVTMAGQFTQDLNFTATQLRALSSASTGFGPEPVPAGWKRLPAGPLRRVRANRLWLIQGVRTPWIVQEGEYADLYAEVVIEGPSSARSEESRQQAESGSVRTRRTAWVETRCGLLVRE